MAENRRPGPAGSGAERRVRAAELSGIDKEFGERGGQQMVVSAETPQRPPAPPPPPPPSGGKKA